MLGITVPTVRAWAKNGLPAVEGVRPTIYRGEDLAAFLKGRDKARKQPCGPGRLFCFGCKAPKIPAFGEVEFHPDGGDLGKLVAMCPDCSAIMVRRASRSTLNQAVGDLHLSIKRADPRLAETTCPL